MRLVQSWISLPTISSNRTIISNLLLIYLSQYALNKSDIFTEFYTDEKFANLLSGLKFTKIDTDILKGIPTNNKCFAYSKMLVLLNTPLDTVHFDCDILIEDTNKIKELQDSEWDGTSWNIETALTKHNSDYFATHTILNMFTDNKYSINEKKTLNTGFLGFRNQKLKNIFLKQYFHNAEIVNRDWNNMYSCWQKMSDLVLRSEGEENAHVEYSPTFDLVIEQSNYTQIVEQNNFNVFTFHKEKCVCGSSFEGIIKHYDVYDASPSSINYNYWNEERVMGIKHYFGGIKYDNSMIQDFYKQLKQTPYYNIFINNVINNSDILLELYNITRDPHLYQFL